MGYRLYRAVRVLLGGLAICVVAVVALAFLAAKRADSIKAKHGHLVGAPASSLAREFRAPDRVERLAPVVYDNATGSITARHEPYIVWTYDLSPRVGAQWSMRVLIDDKTETITRFKGPWD